MPYRSVSHNPMLGIRDPVPFWPTDPGWIKNQYPDILWCGPGSGIWNLFDLGSGMEKIGSGIDKHPVSATLP